MIENIMKWAGNTLSRNDLSLFSNSEEATKE